MRPMPIRAHVRSLSARDGKQSMKSIPPTVNLGSVSSRECLDASAILATFTAVKVAKIANASRHSRLETEPTVNPALTESKLELTSIVK